MTQETVHKENMGCLVKWESKNVNSTTAGKSIGNQRQPKGFLFAKDETIWAYTQMVTAMIGNKKNINTHELIMTLKKENSALVNSRSC